MRDEGKIEDTYKALMFFTLHPIRYTLSTALLVSVLPDRRAG